MAGSYWIKLYHEILNDPKMARLSDRTWRRTIELFLLAGSIGRDGLLPETDDIAWALRVTVGTLKKDLSVLETAGILRKVEGGWLVVNFQKRNAPATVAQRVRKHRETKQRMLSNESITSEKHLSNDGVTKRYTDTDTDTDTDADTDTDTDAVAAVFQAYESEIGIITPHIADEIKDLLEDTPSEWFVRAFEESAKQNKRSWSYAKAILKRWKVEGFDNGAKKSKQPKYEMGYRMIDGELTQTWTDENGVEHLEDPAKAVVNA